MKKLFLALLICILPSVGIAQDQLARLNAAVVSGNVPTVSSPYCSSCTGTTDADALCEDWASTERCTWSTSCAASWTCTDDATRTAGIGCTDAGSESIKIIKSADGGLSYWCNDLGTGRSTVYVQFYIYVGSITLTTGNDLIVFAGGRYGCGSGQQNDTFQFGLYNSSGNTRFMLGWIDGSTYLDIGSSNVSTGVWYPVRIAYTSGSSIQWWVDYNNDGDFDDGGENEGQTSVTESYNFRFLGPYVTSGYFEARINVEIANIKIDITAMPGACSR